jgi:RimJ/RimL family protein N-acetyltransferase
MLPAARGRGVASVALAAMCRWAFDDLGLHRLDLVHSEHNPASCAVATRNGFEHEGLMRHFGLHDDGWHDYHRHARIRD